MISSAPIVTDAGKSLFLRSISGEKIAFTRFKIGNGELPTGGDGSNMTDLINSVLSFQISETDDSQEGNLIVRGHFESSDIASDFRWTEIGLFCVGETSCKFSGDGEAVAFTITAKPAKVHKVVVGNEIVTVSSYDSSTGVVTLSSAPASGESNITAYYTDDNEVLYAYANDGENAGIMRANMTNVVSEHSVSFVISIGDSENVTAILSQSILYAEKATLDAHLSATNPHHVTAAQIGLGNVPNETTNDQKPTYTVESQVTELVSGEKLGVAFGKIAKAIKSLMTHLTNRSNPHQVTYSQTGAAKSTHEHSAADINTGVLPVSRGGTGCSSIAELRSLLGVNNGIISGTYTGTGEKYQFINLGFTPSRVSVYPYEESPTFYNSGIATSDKNAVISGYGSYESTDYANPNSLSSYYHYIKVAIAVGGFYVCRCSVSGHAKTNESGVVYSYMAEKQ